jgi:hypothetical protein
MIITDKIEASGKILVPGSFSDVRRGEYMGRLVAVKKMRVTKQDDFLKIRKVSIDSILSDTWDAVSIILPQRFCKEVVLWSTLSHPNILKLAGVQGDHGERTIHHGVGVDDAREHHGVHQKQSRQQTGTGA